MKKLFFYLLSILVLSSCQKNDDEKVEIPIDRSKLVGEWISVSGNSATILTFSGSSGVSIKTYRNLLDNYSTIEDDGAWSYYPESQVLRFSFYYHSYPDMAVVELSDNTMKLRNRDLNTIDTYVKLLGTYGVVTNESDTININSVDTPISYSSSNPNVVSVSNDGVIKGQKSGIGFITLNYSVDTVMVKVSVNDRPDYYSKEVLGTIDNVLEIHGQPDISGDLGNNKGILYNVSLRDSKLSSIQYHYDNETREITRILTVYKEKADWENDGNLIKKNYVDGGNGTSYWDNEFFPKSTLLFEVFYKEKGKSRSRRDSMDSYKAIPFNPIVLEPIGPIYFVQYDYYVSYGNITYYQIHKYY